MPSIARSTAILALALLSVALPSHSFTFNLDTLSCTGYSYRILLTPQEFKSAYSTNFIIDDGTPYGTSFGAFGFVGGSMALVKQANTEYTDSGQFGPNMLPTSTSWRVGMALQDSSGNIIPGGSSFSFIANRCSSNNGGTGQSVLSSTTTATSTSSSTTTTRPASTTTTSLSSFSTTSLSSSTLSSTTPITTPQSTTTSTSISTSPSPLITSPLPPTPTPISHNHTGAIVGAVVGVLVFLAATAMLLFVLVRRRKAKQTPNGDDFFAADPNAGTIEKGYGDDRHHDDPEDAGVLPELPRDGDVQNDSAPMAASTTTDASPTSPRPDNPLLLNTDAWKVVATSSEPKIDGLSEPMAHR